MATAYKTPGVYVEEIPKFPPSIAPVETAIPAFIGYTEKAIRNSESLAEKPTRIESIAEYEQLFGREPPQDVEVFLDNNNNFVRAEAASTLYLYDSLRMFYANGGGKCYIVSVGSYSDSKTNMSKDAIEKGLNALGIEDEPTIILMPDAVSLSGSGLYEVQQEALKQCNKLMDRVLICDLTKADDFTDFDNSVDAFRTSIGINSLKYGAAYGPWIKVNLPRQIWRKNLILKRAGDRTTIELESLANNNGDISNLIKDVKLAETTAESLEKTKTDISGAADKTLDDSLQKALDQYMLLTDSSTAGELASALQRFTGLALKIAQAVERIKTPAELYPNGAKSKFEISDTKRNYLLSNPGLKKSILELAVHHQLQGADANAKTSANQAKTDAATAKTAAEKAKTDAATAKTAAEKAKTDAATAKTAAEKAKIAADKAQLSPSDTDARNEFKAAAEAAANAAKTAQTTATESKTAADTAKTAADNAKTAADAAKNAPGYATKLKGAADAAKAAAEAAQIKADNAKTAADAAQTEADNAKTAAEATATSPDDLAKLTAAVNAAKAAADAAQTAANAAQAAEDTVKTAADKAKTAADAAKTVAEDAIKITDAYDANYDAAFAIAQAKPIANIIQPESDLDAAAKLFGFADKTALISDTTAIVSAIATVVALYPNTVDTEKKRADVVRAAAYSAVQQAITLFNSIQASTAEFEKNLNATLLAAFGKFKELVTKAAEALNLLPPSGSIAGVYATIDRERGVWKAPANISLNSVISPAVKISHEQQAEYNVDVNAGKSINIIRAFTGKGTLIWGARTLAGNDNEWRYINVRRFFNFVEESTKKATEQFVFEPNDANTWVKVQAMIENFLTTLWRQGALQGMKPEHAFYVAVGLGETMTPLDILEGRMIVEIGMAAVRPAEFIILRFSHKMAES